MPTRLLFQTNDASSPPLIPSLLFTSPHFSSLLLTPLHSPPRYSVAPTPASITSHHFSSLPITPPHPPKPATPPVNGTKESP